MARHFHTRAAIKNEKGDVSWWNKSNPAPPVIITKIVIIFHFCPSPEQQHFF
jgi:hypothetical protein